MDYILSHYAAIIAQTVAILWGAWKTAASLGTQLESIKNTLQELKQRMDGADKRVDSVNGRIDFLYMTMNVKEKPADEKV